MATQEKLKKGFMSSYNSSTKNQKQKRKPFESLSHSLLLKRLENSQVIEHGGRRGVERGGGGNLAEARKSVSHVQSNLASVITFLQVKVLVSEMPGFIADSCLSLCQTNLR